MLSRKRDKPAKSLHAAPAPNEEAAASRPSNTSTIFAENVQDSQNSQSDLDKKTGKDEQ